MLASINFDRRRRPKRLQQRWSQNLYAARTMTRCPSSRKLSTAFPLHRELPRRCDRRRGGSDIVPYRAYRNRSILRS